jgi:hypothetical protein
MYGDSHLKLNFECRISNIRRRPAPAGWRIYSNLTHPRRARVGDEREEAGGEEPQRVDCSGGATSMKDDEIADVNALAQLSAGVGAVQPT